MAYTWPDGLDMQSPKVYVSPYEDATHPQALFVSSSDNYGIPRRERREGADQVHRQQDEVEPSWPGLEGVPVQDLAFDPNDHSHLVAVTSDMAASTHPSDWGDTWTQVTTTGLTPSSLGER